VIVSNKHPKLVPKLPRVPDEQARPVDENLGVDDVLGEEIEELEELVVGVLVLDVLLNFLEEGDLVGRSEGAARVVCGDVGGLVGLRLLLLLLLELLLVLDLLLLLGRMMGGGRIVVDGRRVGLVVMLRLLGLMRKQGRRYDQPLSSQAIIRG
jgi:hypothetical protein